MKYLIIDWMNNVCFDTENENLTDFDETSEYLDRKIEEELAMDGLNPYGENADITEGFTRLATDEDFNHYRGEYEIQEFDEEKDRTMYRGNRLVLIKNYYAIECCYEMTGTERRTWKY